MANDDLDEDTTEQSEMAERIRLDMSSKYADIRCPVHNVPPEFEVGPEGAVIERVCCEALAQIFGELRATEDDEDDEVDEVDDEVTEETSPLDG
jgi:hypothetical protein